MTNANNAALEAVQVEPTAIVCDCEGTTDDDGRPLHYALLYLDHPLPPGTELYATPQEPAVNAELLAALQAILPFIPKSSESDGGASKYSASVKAADKVRAAIAKATREAA